MNFWYDICRCSHEHVFFYHMSNTNTKKDSYLEGLPAHEGKLNRAMNLRILTLCKSIPLSCYLFSKAFLISQGAGDLYHLKQRVFRSMAENIIRYRLPACHVMFIGQASFLIVVLICTVYIIVGVCLFSM